jgi:hypothetical protein
MHIDGYVLVHLQVSKVPRTGHKGDLQVDKYVAVRFDVEESLCLQQKNPQAAST